MTPKQLADIRKSLSKNTDPHAGAYKKIILELCDEMEFLMNTVDHIRNSYVGSLREATRNKEIAENYAKILRDQFGYKELSCIYADHYRE